MKKLLLIFLCCLAGLAVFSQSTFNAEDLLKPGAAPKTLVNDYSGTLTADQKQALESKLVAFDDSTSTQIAVVIVPNLNGNDISDFNTKLGRAWGVGGSKFNNGVVLLISKEEHHLNIATGYGAEGALPDITCKHIIDNNIVPAFKGDDYYRGIDDGTTAIMQALKGEYTAPEGYNATQGKSHVPWGTIIFIIIMILIAIGSGAGGGGGGIGNALFWTAMMSGRGGGGGFGGGSSGGGGGGFGGFGGGSFGGGGASGSW
jgi:uncharacterized protein